MKPDINRRADIELLVNTFYDRVRIDQAIGYLFTDVARVNWDEHLPKMYNFWENILFFTGNYSGSPMVVHRELHAKSRMNEMHFARWIELFCDTVDRLFEGPRANEIKDRATNIAAVMMYKTLSYQP
ncbi:MAG TPA: group III truncated hemoglobin [Flavobacterium sp.]|nr:group III truncated hemoglobin [Flavobacterium sp.]